MAPDLEESLVLEASGLLDRKSLLARLLRASLNRAERHPSPDPAHPVATENSTGNAHTVVSKNPRPEICSHNFPLREKVALIPRAP